MRWRLVALAAGVTTLALGAALAAGEAAVRYRERHRTVVPGTQPTLYYRHYRLRHALVRDFSYYGWSGIDSSGFRRTAAPQKAGARPLVLVVGGSTVFDSQVSRDDRAWPAVVERLWRDGSPPFEGDVLNGGVPGYLVVDNLIRLETDLADLQPDLLVIYDGHNDVYASLVRPPGAGFAPRPGRIQPLAPWTAWLEEHSLLYAKLAGRLQALRSRRRAETRVEARAGGATPVDWPARIEAAVRRFTRDLETLVAVARARRIPVVLMTVTHVSAGDSLPADAALTRSWLLTVGGAPAAVTLETYRRYNAAVRDVARRHGLPLLDAAESGVRGAALYAEDDPIHFNDAGAEQFARFVAPRLAPFLPAPARAALLH